MFYKTNISNRAAFLTIGWAFFFRMCSTQLLSLPKLCIFPHLQRLISELVLLVRVFNCAFLQLLLLPLLPLLLLFLYFQQWHGFFLHSAHFCFIGGEFNDRTQKKIAPIIIQLPLFTFSDRFVLVALLILTVNMRAESNISIGSARPHGTEGMRINQIVNIYLW